MCFLCLCLSDIMPGKHPDGQHDQYCTFKQLTSLFQKIKAIFKITFGKQQAVICRSTTWFCTAKIYRMIASFEYKNQGQGHFWICIWKPCPFSKIVWQKLRLLCPISYEHISSFCIKYLKSTNVCTNTISGDYFHVHVYKAG